MLKETHASGVTHSIAPGQASRTMNVFFYYREDFGTEVSGEDLTWCLGTGVPSSQG